MGITSFKYRKCSLKIKLSLVIVSIISTFNVQAQWLDVGPGSAVNPDNPRNVFCLAPIDDQVLWASPVHPTSADVREIIRTIDGGQSWDIKLLPETDGNHSPVRIVALSDDEAWVLALRYPAPGRARLFHTTDGGDTWVNVPGPFNEVNKGVQNIHFFNNQEAVVFGSPRTGSVAVDFIRIYRTTDAGATWTELFEPLIPQTMDGESYLLLSGNNSYAAVGDTLWFPTTQNRIFRTVNRGANFQVFSTPLSGSNTIVGLASVAFKDALNGMVVSLIPQQGAVTSNGGSTWTILDNMPEAPAARCVQYVPGTNNTYVITDGYDGNSNALSITFDGGQNWETLLGNPGMNCVQFLSNTQGWGGSNITGSVGGIYSWQADLSTVLTVSQSSPGNTSIYPNPTEDFLYFRIEPFTAFDMEVTIFDLSGKLCMQERLAAVGESRLNVSKLPKGMYLVSINSGEKAFYSKFVKL